MSHKFIYPNFFGIQNLQRLFNFIKIVREKLRLNMSACWRLKITLVGSSRVGKTSFIKGRPDFEVNRLNNLRTFGVSFEIIDTFLDNEEICRSSVWEINQRASHSFLYPIFFKGAAGCLLIFDLFHHETFEDLKLWIKLIRKINGNIPVFLIGTNNDLRHEVFPEEIDDFVRNYGIIGYSPTSIHEENKRDIIFKQLITNVIERHRAGADNYNHVAPIQESVEDLLNQLSRRDYNRYIPVVDPYESLSSKEKLVFDQFIANFAFCPICKIENHANYLKKFYFSKKRKDTELKNQLLKLMVLSEDFEKLYYNKIKLGIPCCDCFQSIFAEKAPGLIGI